MSTQDRHEPRCGVWVRCEFSMILARMIRAVCSSLLIFASIWSFRLLVGQAPSGPVNVVDRLLLQGVEPTFHPFDGLVDPLLEGNPILPAELASYLVAVEPVGGVLAQAL